MADTPAKRGDLVVTKHAQIGYGGTQDRTSYEVGVVTSVSRGGLVTAYRNSWGSIVRREQGDVFFGTEPKIVGQGEVDVERAFAAVRRHTWPGHPNQPMAYDSLGEVKTAIGRYSRSLRGT